MSNNSHERGKLLYTWSGPIDDGWSMLETELFKYADEGFTEWDYKNCHKKGNVPPFCDSVIDLFVQIQLSEGKQTDGNNYLQQMSIKIIRFPSAIINMYVAFNRWVFITWKMIVPTKNQQKNCVKGLSFTFVLLSRATKAAMWVVTDPKSITNCPLVLRVAYLWKFFMVVISVQTKKNCKFKTTHAYASAKIYFVHIGSKI